MTTQEIKTEIQKSLDKVPDSILQSILDFLKKVEAHPTDKLNRTLNFKKILNEDKELLDRLAK
jgi:mRNA-degrading endonuclease RelE of RelBE toxin-antitoxin system